MERKLDSSRQRLGVRSERQRNTALSSKISIVLVALADEFESDGKNIKFLVLENHNGPLDSSS